MVRPVRIYVCFAVLTCLAGFGVARGEVKVDSYTFGSLEARAIGPAEMGGRIAAMDAVYREGRLHIFVGSASGGVWKSVNGGTSFKPVFDDHTQSIGAVTIDRSNPDVVWAGTGEAWTRNSVSVGTGVYKTTDGGEKWEHVGLEDTERIVKILIHPKDGNRVYVCAPGHLWDANEQRGVFKTTDGGKSWEKVLYVNADTGCGDLAMDPQEPDILYAGMWQFRRWPYFFESGGPGSGLYKTTDGGKSWRRITQGLPEEDLGRIALAVAPSRPCVVYVTVEAAQTAMYRSDDLGETWRRVGSNMVVEMRPFYFSLLVPHPTDHRKVYKPGFTLAASTDGGETFSMLGGGTHPDHHALWIDPDRPDHMLVGTDGGLYESNDAGVSWRFLQALPISQFYEISYDMEDPYHVYGGLQDNGTWYAPTRAPNGIRNKDWRNIGFGDGFHVFVDRADPEICYVEWQGGRIMRVNRKTGEAKDIQPLPELDQPKLRFNWNTPIHLSPNRADTIYIGAQYLFRSRNRGEFWERISPDLTTDDPAKQRQIESGGLSPDNSTAENHCTIYSISESPLDADVIWVGTDDGNLQVSRDGGATWRNAAGNIPNLPAGTWVSHVEASRHVVSAAYATFDGHCTGDKTPYVYRTEDFGQTWTALVPGDVEGYAHVIREDIVNPSLLFLGTEFGLYISLDKGASWARFKGKVPKVAVRDIAIHPREHDLILGTHGRGVLIVDDITPLRRLTSEVLESEFAVLESRPAVMRIPVTLQDFPGDDEYVGPSVPSGAQVSYYLRKRHLFGELKIEVLDDQGQVITTIPGITRRGVNRVRWFMREKAPKVPPASTLVQQAGAMVGPQVPAGEYTFRLIKDAQTAQGRLSAVMDPRADYTTEGMARQDRLVWKLFRMLNRLTYLVDALADVQKQCQGRVAKLGRGADADAAEKLRQDLEALRKTIVATRKGGALAGEEQLRERMGQLYGAVNSFEGRPTDSQVRYADVLEAELQRAERAFADMLADQMGDFNERLRTRGLESIRQMTREEWDKQQAGN